jgi:photosystem II stability/assembly factor-like uncharacterized protein
MQRRRSVLLAICIILFIYFEIHSCSQDEIAGPGVKPPVESIILSANDVYFYDAHFGCVTGALGTVMTTSDGGTTWKGAVVDESILSAVQFLSPLTGWLGGKDGALYETDDGGISWKKAGPGGYPAEEDFSKIQFVNDRIGYVLGYHGVYRTTNGGATWENNWLTDSQYRGAWDMSFVDGTTGFLLGCRYTDPNPPVLYRTTDGAASWTEVEGSTASVLRTILTIHFVDSLTGWAGGGAIMKTTDGGETWTTEVAVATVRKFYFVDGGRGVAVGGKTILETRDGGSTWRNSTPDDQRIADLRGVWFADEEHGWVVGRGRDERAGEKLYKHSIILKTTDGGTTWDITDFPYDCTEIQNVETATGS